MKKHSLLISITLIVLIVVLGYLTHLNKTSGVPFYRHNDVYEILKSDSISTNNDFEKNYTEPQKKYSIIGVDDLGMDNYKDSIVISKKDNKVHLLPKNENQ